jgi:two-component system response regulator NreC
LRTSAAQTAWNEREERPVTGADRRIAIVLAVGQAATRCETRRLLEGAVGLDVVSEAGDAESAVQAVLRHKPAVFVLDLDGPGDLSSLDAIRDATQASPATSVVVLVARADERFVRHALHAGAFECVLRDTPAEELVEAVGRAAHHARAASALESEQPPDNLTGREFDVLRLLALGHTNAEIAQRLHLSVRTVEAHRAHLQRKLSRSTRAELVRYALDRGLLPGTEDGERG